MIEVSESIKNDIVSRMSKSQWSMTEAYEWHRRFSERGAQLPTLGWFFHQVREHFDVFNAKMEADLVNPFIPEEEPQGKYELVKVLIADAPEPSHKGKVGTPVIGYVLKDTETGTLEVFNKANAYFAITVNGCINAEANLRETEAGMNPYIKPTDGKKINEYMINIGV